jgi:hypothetical protein
MLGARAAGPGLIPVCYAFNEVCIQGGTACYTTIRQLTWSEMGQRPVAATACAHNNHAQALHAHTGGRHLQH